MSFLGLEYVNPAAVEPVLQEVRNRAIDGGVGGTVFGHVRWRVELPLEPRAFSNASGRVAVHRAMHGTLRTFMVPMPQLVPGAIADDPGQVMAAAAAGASSVMLRSAQEIMLPVGWFVGLGSGVKVYQVDGDADYMVTAAGVAVRIVPNLLAAVAADARWQPNPDLLCRYAAGSDAAWRVNGASVVAPRIVVEED